MVVLWHSGSTLNPSLHSLCTRKLWVVTIYSLFHSWDRVWQTPLFPPSDLPTYPFLSTSSEETQTKHQHGKHTAWYTQARLQKQGREAAFLKQKSWAECQVPSKTSIKSHWAVSQHLHTKALTTLFTCFPDTLAVISTRQRPLSWQLFQERFNLPLREYMQSLLRGNKHLLK